MKEEQDKKVEELTEQEIQIEKLHSVFQREEALLLIGYITLGSTVGYCLSQLIVRLMHNLSIGGYVSAIIESVAFIFFLGVFFIKNQMLRVPSYLEKSIILSITTTLWTILALTSYELSTTIIMSLTLFPLIFSVVCFGIFSKRTKFRVIKELDKFQRETNPDYVSQFDFEEKEKEKEIKKNKKKANLLLRIFFSKKDYE